MARARNIKPGFFTNEELTECPALARILFIGLWCLADREGRLEDRPKRIKIEILPYDDCNVDELLQHLHNHNLIIRYQVDDGKYIQVTNFIKHQKPHHMEAPSIIPPPLGKANKYNHEPVTKEQRERIFERDGNKCTKCDSTEKLHLDHIVPVSKGGTSQDDNLRILCQICNLKKGNRIENESRTNRERIDQEASCSTDSLLLIPDSPSLIPDTSTGPSPVVVPEEEKFKFVLPDWVPEQDWKDFCQMRGKGFTARAKHLIVLDLEELRKSGQDPGGVLRESIKRGWKGVFEIKEEKNGTRPSNYAKSGGVPSLAEKQRRVAAAMLSAGSGKT